tara:strand:+ start:1793 stop:2104 length:312 start_codon:yes stop_codon:yes gene_type:complete
MMARPWPEQLRFSKADKALHVRFDDGKSFSIPFQTLRVESPSAEVQGHGPDQKVTVTGKENVQISAANPVGRYAVRLVFDDGHDSGLFTWDYLYALGQAELRP